MPSQMENLWAGGKQECCNHRIYLSPSGLIRFWGNSNILFNSEVSSLSELWFLNPTLQSQINGSPWLKWSYQQTSLLSWRLCSVPESSELAFPAWKTVYLFREACRDRLEAWDLRPSTQVPWTGSRITDLASSAILCGYSTAILCRSELPLPPGM